MKDRHIYPAIFSYDDDGISVEFPDLPGCLTAGQDTAEAMKNAKEALELALYGFEEDHEDVPEPSAIRTLHLEPDQTFVLVEVWMIPVRDYMENRSIKKTLTIPKWLNDMAEDHNVNFSRLLQQAIKNYLGIEKQV